MSLATGGIATSMHRRALSTKVVAARRTKRMCILTLLRVIRIAMAVAGDDCTMARWRTTLLLDACNGNQACDHYVRNKGSDVLASVRGDGRTNVEDRLQGTDGASDDSLMAMAVAHHWGKGWKGRDLFGW